MLDSAPEERDGGDRLLVWKDLDIGQTRGVIDSDVDVLPADTPAAHAGRVGPREVVPAFVGDSMAHSTLDPSELLDVDVQELAGTLALVALRGLQAEPAELAHPDPSQDPRHGRERHIERLSDLRAGHPQSPERRDHLDAPVIHSIGHQVRGRRAIQQTDWPLGPIADQPLARGAVTDSGRLGGLRQRPPRVLNTVHE